LKQSTLPYRLLGALYLVLGIVPLANALIPGSVRWWGAATEEWLSRGTVLVLAILLLVLVFVDRTDALIAAAERALLKPSSRAFAIGAAIFATCGAAALAWYCFSGMPFTSDEMAQQWHARVLLSGRLSAIPEAHPEFFNTAPVFDRGGRWFSQYPIGGPAFIALGLAVNAAWLVNPVLIGVATWQLYRFLRLAQGELTARVVTLVFVTSPMVLIMAASQMNHVSALAFTLMALASLAAWDSADARQASRHGLAIGVAIGVVTLVRPLDGALVAAVIGVFQVIRVWRDRARAASLVVEVAALAVLVAVLLWANARTTGHPFLFGYEALNGPEHAMGFHVDPNGVMHTPRRGLALASGYLMRLDRYLFEWPLPAMLFVVAALLTLKRPTRWDALLAALSFVFLLGYGAYWFDGFFAGPRFLFTALPAFVYFAAIAPGVVAGSAIGRFGAVRRVALLLVPICVFLAWLGPTGVNSARARIASYNDQRTKLKTDIDAQAARANVHHALVLVNEGWRGRLQARLRVLGVSQFRAERVLNTVDACALQTALDAGDSARDLSARERAERAIAQAAAYGQARMEQGRQADQVIALVPGSRPTPVCLEEFLRDTSGTMSYPIFLERQRIAPDGRVGGDIVYARDLGERDTLLRARFGDRAWYRYRAPRQLDDTTNAFIPLAPIERSAQ
jgi:hypothetical protein